MIVLDANILIRAVIGRRVRSLLDRYGAAGFRFLATKSAFVEAEKHLPKLISKFERTDLSRAGP